MRTKFPAHLSTACGSLIFTSATTSRTVLSLPKDQDAFTFFIRGFNQFAETVAAGGTMTSAGGMLDFSAFGGVGAMSAPVILCAVTSL